MNIFWVMYLYIDENHKNNSGPPIQITFDQDWAIGISYKGFQFSSYEDRRTQLQYSAHLSFRGEGNNDLSAVCWVVKYANLGCSLQVEILYSSLKSTLKMLISWYIFMYSIFISCTCVNVYLTRKKQKKKKNKILKNKKIKNVFYYIYSLWQLGGGTLRLKTSNKITIWIHVTWWG